MKGVRRGGQCHVDQRLIFREQRRLLVHYKDWLATEVDWLPSNIDDFDL